MKYELTTALITYGGYDFTVKGKTIITSGFKDVEKILAASSASEDGGDILPELTEGQILNNAKAALSEHLTTPPTPYTEDNIITKLVSMTDEEYNEIELLPTIAPKDWEETDYE